MTAQTVRLQASLVIEQCCSCGIVFAVPGDWQRSKKNDHETIFCPNGHRFHYPGESDEERLRRRLEFEKNRREAAERRAEHTERRRRAEKAAKTRIKNRIANGVCPCCNRTFKNLHRHMESQHPDYSEQAQRELRE